MDPIIILDTEETIEEEIKILKMLEKCPALKNHKEILKKLRQLVGEKLIKEDFEKFKHLRGKEYKVMFLNIKLLFLYISNILLKGENYQRYSKLAYALYLKAF